MAVGSNGYKEDRVDSVLLQFRYPGRYRFLTEMYLRCATDKGIRGVSQLADCALNCKLPHSLQWKYRVGIESCSRNIITGMTGDQTVNRSIRRYFAQNWRDAREFSRPAGSFRLRHILHAKRLGVVPFYKVTTRSKQRDTCGKTTELRVGIQRENRQRSKGGRSQAVDSL